MYQIRHTNYVKYTQNEDNSFITKNNRISTFWSLIQTKLLFEILLLTVALFLKFEAKDKLSF